MTNRPVSSHMTDEDLSEILAGCASGLYEAWMPHPRCQYLVSSFGRIWSRYWNRLLTPYEHNGYPAIRISGKNRRVHSLVLETFISDRPKGMEACHYDNNKQNNMLMNLRWDTARGNRQDNPGYRESVAASRAALLHVRVVARRVLADNDRDLSLIHI